MSRGAEGGNGGFRPLVLGLDAGGTMTDTFIVDEQGSFVIGKASTTPWDESEGFLESAADALSYLPEGEPRDLESLFAQLEVVLYGGTTMLNTLLSRTGKKLGLLTTKGFEDMPFQGRGVQIWAEYPYADRLHPVTHVHPAPLLKRRQVRGVTERVDMFGDVAIPLYEHEVANAVDGLLGEGIEALCVCFLFSYVNPAHERRAGEIAAERLRASGKPDLPVFLSSEVRPVMREFSRLNSTLIEAYAAAPVRAQLHRVEDAARSRGFEKPLQTLLSYGGLANIRYPRLHETLVSGPVGGVLGAQYIAGIIGIENVVVSDLGGTSFDMGAITRNVAPIDHEPTLARFRLNLPTVRLESIGAGAGTIIKVDPATKKIFLGPESAGSHPGPVAFARGGTRATICDCDTVLGYLNPDNFLGGKIKLDVDKAYRAIGEQIASEIGLDVHDAAEGVVELLNTQVREALRRLVGAKGLDVGDYHLMSYGGAGPLHLAGYSQGLGFKGVLTFPFAAAFSAFGCTTADYLHRYTKSFFVDVAPDAGDETKASVAREIDAVWDEMAALAAREMAGELDGGAEITLRPIALMRYTGQLNDLEVPVPLGRLEDARGWDALVRAFEETYERINSRVSKYEEAGYSVFELGLLASVDKVKPRIARHPLAPATPRPRARKGSRGIYRRGEWVEAAIWDMERLLPGNEVAGPAVIEHPATTFLVPDGQRTYLDEWNIFRLEDA